MLWYKQNKEELFEILETSDNGLTKNSVEDRLREYGLNQVNVKKESIWSTIIEPFKSIFVAVLIVAALISLLSGEMLDAIIIGSIIVINSVIFYIQSYTTAKVLASLKKHSLQQVRVVRSGSEHIISSLNLVPGDIIIVNEGEKIPADGRVIHTDDLQIDESSLTGESIPVRKHASTLDSNKQIYEQDNMVFQGTYVVAGMARVLIVETGSRTEYSKIASLVEGKKNDSPVNSKINDLIALIVKVTGVLAVIVFILSLSRGIPADEALRFVMAVTVSAVPEGLPVALTVIIVLGMRRMAKQKALVHTFGAIEDIGLITTIATDKTGTLTKNKLTVVDDWSIGKSEKVLEIARRTIDSSVSTFDPIDKALVEYIGDKKSIKIDRLYPFDIALRMSGAYVELDKTVYIKGSPEHIILKSNLTDSLKHAAQSTLHEFASKGYRVIAFGKIIDQKKEMASLEGVKDGQIEFVGFLAFADELRLGVKKAINDAKKAGISVRLITGDHYETAFNIGKQLNLASHVNQVAQGFELPTDTDELSKFISDKTIFSRILPQDKFKILQALKKTEITAMTGDGVNDVPALANANVGIAMGSGSDIAKDAGGIVLLDDNFTTIVKAIAEGRKIFDNIRRMLFYLLSTSIGEIATMIGSLLFNLPLPVTAIQVLWINLVTDTALVLPLGLEPEEDGYMTKPPRDPKAPILSKIMITRMILIALTMAVITLIAVVIMKAQGKSVEYIQTVSFLMLIVAQWANAFNARSEFASSFSRLKSMNYGLLIGFGIAVILQAMVMFGPLMSVFEIVKIEPMVLAVSSGIMVVSILLVSEIHKIFCKR